MLAGLRAVERVPVDEPGGTSRQKAQAGSRTEDRRRTKPDGTQDYSGHFVALEGTPRANPHRQYAYG